ncbi:hypothetical protein Bca101_085863 [Brassica carinata]
MISLALCRCFSSSTYPKKSADVTKLQIGIKRGLTLKETQQMEFFSQVKISDSTIDAFNSFVCETGAGNHILGALFVDLEPLLLMKSVPKLTGSFYILSSLSPGTTSSYVVALGNEIADL